MFEKQKPHAKSPNIRQPQPQTPFNVKEICQGEKSLKIVFYLVYQIIDLTHQIEPSVFQCPCFSFSLPICTLMCLCAFKLTLNLKLIPPPSYYIYPINLKDYFYTYVCEKYHFLIDNIDPKADL